MQIYNLILYCLLIAVITLSGCGRTEDVAIEPQTVVSDPKENEVFTIFDTIQINAVIKHVSNIEKINLTVTDRQLKPVISSKSIAVTGNEIVIDTFLVVDNKYIEDNLHYLHIEIKDGRNLFNSWTTINITPLKKELSNLMFVSGVGTLNNLQLINENDENIKVYSWTSDYLSGFIDSRYRIFYTAGYNNGGLIGRNLDNNSANWAIAGQPTGNIPYFNSFSAIEGRVSLGLWDGSIDSYDQNGMKIFSSPKLTGGRFSHIVNLKRHIIGIFTPFTSGNRKLLIYNYPAGNLYQSLEVDGNPVGLIRISDFKAFLLIENDGMVKAYQYNSQEKSLDFIHNVTNHNVIDVDGDAQNMFLATGDAILWYRSDINSTVKYLSVSDSALLVFEPEDKMLYVSMDKQIIAYQLPSVVPQKIYEVDEHVKDILLLYNK
jgi:hypothetical protein